MDGKSIQPGRKMVLTGMTSSGERHHLHPAAEEFVYLAVILDAFSRG